METKTQADPRYGKIDIQVPESLQQPLPRNTTEGDSVTSEVKESVGGLPHDYHLKFAEETHQYVREYIRNADQKAGFFFAAATAILAFFHKQNAAARWLKPIHGWSFIDGLAFVAMGGLAISAFVFLLVVVPRLPGSRRGLIYFNAIAEYDSPVEYADDIYRRTAAELSRNKLLHAFELARICRRKYGILLVGFWVGSVGAFTSLLYLFLA